MTDCDTEVWEVRIRDTKGGYGMEEITGGGGWVSPGRCFYFYCKCVTS